MTHNLTSRYNAFQFSASKQTGIFNFWLPIPSEKVSRITAKILSTSTAATARSFDRSQNLNVSYLINLPNVSAKYLGNHKVLNGVLDGWQFTGIEQFASATRWHLRPAPTPMRRRERVHGFHNRTISFYSNGPDMSNRNLLALRTNRPYLRWSATPQQA